MNEDPLQPARADLLFAKIQQTRVAYAEKLAAVENLRDAATLRLEALKDELSPILAVSSKAPDIVDLTVVPGHPPRLWIDMTSYVLMSPTPSTYSYRRDSLSGSEVIIETADRAAVCDAVATHVASRLIEREKAFNQMPVLETKRASANNAREWLLLALLSALTVGGYVLLFAILGTWQ